MTNEEILNEVKNNFRLEGIEMSPEQEDRILRYLSGEASFESLLMEIHQKYVTQNTEKGKEDCDE